MYTTSQAAKRIEVCKNTLLRWIAEGLIPDVERDWRGWRVWSQEDVNRAMVFKVSYHGEPIPRAKRRPLPKVGYARSAAESMARYGRGCARRARATT